MPRAGMLLVTLALCAPPSRPLVSEVFYDAVGDDSGFEFVELLNPTARAWPLAGLRIESGDGAGPARWTLRWTGRAADTIAAGARFVIGGAGVVPAPHAVATLDLQNGPDAVRLAWPDGAVEVVGYGPHEFAEYSCGAAAPDAPSGSAIARIPDDVQHGSNALDFGVLPPSPGRANRAARDLAWAAGSLVLDPERPAFGAAARLCGRVVNRGTSGAAAGSVVLSATAGGDGNPIAAATLAAALAPGDSAAIELEIAPLASGRHVLRVTVAWPGDEEPANDLDSLRVRVGAAPVEITEIQYHPASGEGEWVEVWNRSGSPLEPAAITLSDRSGTPGRPAPGSAPIPDDRLAVLAQDRAALLARFPGLDSLRVWALAPWASLNNSDDTGGVADVVVVREADGVSSDSHAYSNAGVGAGVPLERTRDGGWRPAAAGFGTPLAPAREVAPLAGRFAVTPRRLVAGAGARIEWSLPWPRGRVAIEAYDLAGTRLGIVMSERLVAARGEQRWDAAGMPPGVILLVLRARPEHGPEMLVERRALRIAGVAP